MFPNRFVTCTAAIGSVTLSIKAQRALLSAGIPSEVRALSPAETRRGCAYGVMFPCDRESGVRAALRANGISASQFLKKDEDTP